MNDNQAYDLAKQFGMGLCRNKIRRYMFSHFPNHMPPKVFQAAFPPPYLIYKSSHVREIYNPAVNRPPYKVEFTLGIIETSLRDPKLVPDPVKDSTFYISLYDVTSRVHLCRAINTLEDINIALDPIKNNFDYDSRRRIL